VIKKERHMHVRVDQTKCVASGNCVLAAPEVFDQRVEDGIVVLLDPSPPAELAERVRRAEALCPAAVISVDD
jgi:ferredoxin